MMLFFLSCLLAVLPVASMKSPIFGPQEMNRVEGSSASIKCYYPPTSVNKHTRKYWCRQENNGICTTLISSQNYVSKDYKDRAKLTDFPENNTFVVDIFNLIKDDSGLYKCGLGVNSRGLSFDVSLQVSQAPVLPGDTEVYKEVLGRTVNIDCPFKIENSPNTKSVCKRRDKDCITVISSSGYIHPDYMNRVKLDFGGGTTALKFTFIMKQLQFTDAGIYVCQTGESYNDKKNVYLQVLKSEPELAYGNLRGSVTIDCAVEDPKVANKAKFLCWRSNGKTCDVVINTLGKKAQAFQGRIVLNPKDNRSFSVLITGLRKEDAGQYLCGASSLGEPEEGSPTQAWQLFINEETPIPPSPSVVKGVEGGSVAVRCPYNPKERNSVKYWCRWEDRNNGKCPLLVQSEGLSQEQSKAYEGRLALYEEPGNGTYTVILNQLTIKDAGFYWCLTNGDIHWTSVVELKIVQGTPTLKVPTHVTALEEGTTTISCHIPCKFYSYEKYWCKWTNNGCKVIPNQVNVPNQPVVSCNEKSQLINLTLSSVATKDAGWYWCGVKDNSRYEETVAVYVEVKKRTKESQDSIQVNAAPRGKVIDSSVRAIENKAIQDASLVLDDRAVKEIKNSADGSKESTDMNSSSGQERSSTILVSTLVPLALVLALGAVALGVARARHRRNVDRASIRSYKTDISMSDFENSRDFGAHDNIGDAPFNQETNLEGNTDFITTTEDTVETEETKKTKRSSKEEADMAYTNFLLQTNNIAANFQERPSEV